MSLPVFEAWLQEHRAVCSGVKFELTQHAGYGARVVEDVGANSTVLAIPRSFLIDFSAAVRSSSICGREACLPVHAFVVDCDETDHADERRRS